MATPFRSGINEIDVDVAIISRCLDRMLVKRDNVEGAPFEAAADTTPTKSVTLPPVQGKYRPSSRRSIAAAPESDPNGLQSEVDIMMKALERIVCKSLDKTEEATLKEREAEKAASDNEAELTRLRDENKQLKAVMEELTAVAATSEGGGLVSSPSYEQWKQTNTPSRPRPTDDSSFWGILSSVIKFGVGDFELHLRTTISMLAIVNESKKWQLQHIADPLLTMRQPIVLVKEMKPPVERLDQSKVDNHGIGHELDVITGSTHAQNNYSMWAQGVVPADNSGKSALCREGILHYIGTGFGEHRWANPTQGAKVVLSASSVWGFGDIQDLSKKDLAYFITKNAPKSWIEIDILCGVVFPVAYSFASAHPMYSGYYPRNWELQASVDKQEWVTLTKHVDDHTISHNSPFGFWKVTLDNPNPNVAEYFCYYRLVQTGPNSFGTNELQVSAFELYGRFMHIMEDKPHPSPPPCFAEERKASSVEDFVLPPQPKPPKPRGKKKK